MPFLSDPSSPPLRSREWFRLAVACVTNFAVLAAPCHAFPDDALPSMAPYADDLMLAALLLGGDGSPRPELASPFTWESPPARKYWRSPELPPGRPAPFQSAWRTPVERVTVATPQPAPAAWQPAAPPAGIDPAPAPGVFGALPIEQQIGNGIVTGEVSDSTTFEPIKGAIVDIVGTGRTAETDAQGRFRIDGLPAGDFIAEASALNYSAVTMGVSPNPSGPVELRFGLKVKPADSGTEEYQLEEETVSIEYNENSQGDFNLTLATEAPSITSGVNRDDFEKTAVSDAGEAIGKVSGANIVDGKYAVVRGLADRYVTTMFNGAQVASADPSRKAIQLDLFPTSVIESIGVDKTYSSWLPADFGGGAINIATRAFPAERILELKAEIEYNDALEDTMYVHPGRDLGFFGNVTHTMPPTLEGNGGFLDPSNTSAGQLDRRWSALHRSQSLRPVADDAEMGHSYGLTYGETFDLGRGNRFGLMTAFAQSSGDESNTGESIHNPVRDYFRDEYTRSVEWSAFVSGALELGENHVVSATYFRKHIAEDTTALSSNIVQDNESLRYGALAGSDTVDISDIFGGDAVYYGESWDIETTLRDLDIFQFRGEHKLWDRGPKLDWNITTSGAEENRPYSTHFEYGVLDFSQRALQPYIEQAYEALDAVARDVAPIFGVDPATATWLGLRDQVVALIGEESTAAIEDQNGLPHVRQGGGPLRLPTVVHGPYVGARDGSQVSSRRSERTLEDASEQQVNLTFPFYYDDSDDRLIELRLGARHFTKERETRTRLYDLYLRSDGGSGSGFTPDFLTQISPDGRTWGQVFAENPDLLVQYFNGTLQGGPYYQNALNTRGVENVLTELEQRAFYADLRFQWDKAFITGGVRQETEDYTIDVLPNPESAFDDDEIAAFGWERRESQDDLLPSFAAGNSFLGDKLHVLGAWSETIARPTFWEFVPTVSVDQTTGISRRGNSTLFRTGITNTDLSFTFLPNDRMTLRTGFFHKDLTRPLVTFYEPTSSGVELLYKDAYIDPATGAATDYTATISGIEVEGEFNELGPFSLKGNFTYIDAQLTYFYEVEGQPEEVTSQLPYQPQMILNGTLSHVYEPWDLTTSLVLNYTGGYPVILKRRANDSEVTRDALTTLDLVLSKEIERDGVDFTIGFGVKNLLSTEDNYHYEGRSYSQDFNGRSYWLEAKARF
jgi:hypothetical protein